ncbi:phytochrome sensor protein [Methylobacterium durans]|uniref:Phytochrome sensor protein n=1 Tax=Methylobacterium durans TaxID=2202825 RepID=A0A2U8WDZ8_9HYPH|nr:phytochrome sensor protein [Methylobacterium durans]
MRPPNAESRSGTTVGAGVITTGSVVLAVAVLYFGRDIFVPFALALLLSFALAPPVLWLRRLRLPKVAAIAITVSLAFGLIGGIGFIVAGQLVQLAGNLPAYQDTIKTKLQTLRTDAPGGGVVAQVTETIKDLSQELSEPKPAGSSGTVPGTLTQPKARAPIPVTIEQGAAQPIQIIQTVLGPIIAPLATAGLVIVFVVFILIEREDLRDRFLKLVGADDLQTSSEAINDAAARVSRYLLMQLVVNLTYGVPLGLGLYLIGVPNPFLWGLLAALLRFVPYLGPFLAALFPVALAFAVDPGWSMLGWTIALFLVLELISNNVVEPWLYGTSTGLSSLAIIMAAIFWTSLWGPVGLFLSTPLTVCLVVIGRYVPQLEFLGVLLGSEPVLAPEQRFYQRLLSGNAEEAVEIAENYVDEKSALAFYDEVALPALRLAEVDRRRTTSDKDFRLIVAEGTMAVVREVAEHVRERRPTVATDAADSTEAAAQSEIAEPVEAPDPVLCVAGRTELDEAAAAMLAQILVDDAGVQSRVLPASAISLDALGRLDLTSVKVVCLSYFHPKPEVYVRYVCRRLKRRSPKLKIVAGLWGRTSVKADDLEDVARALAADAVAPSIEEVRRNVLAWRQSPSGL